MIIMFKTANNVVIKGGIEISMSLIPDPQGSCMCSLPLLGRQSEVKPILSIIINFPSGNDLSFRSNNAVVLIKVDREYLLEVTDDTENKFPASPSINNTLTKVISLIPPSTTTLILSLTTSLSPLRSAIAVSLLTT